jgi:hypothetical protein
MSTQKFIGIADVAKEFGVTTVYINNLIHFGSLKATKFAKVWVVDPESLETLRRHRANKAMKKVKPDK